MNGLLDAYPAFGPTAGTRTPEDRDSSRSGPCGFPYVDGEADHAFLRCFAANSFSAFLFGTAGTRSREVVDKAARNDYLPLSTTACMYCQAPADPSPAE